MNKITMNWKNALKLALLLSLFWTLIGAFGKIGFGSHNDIHLDFLIIITMFVRQLLIMGVIFFLFIGFQFSIFNRSWKFRKKLWVSIAGSISIALFLMILSIIFSHHDFQPPHEKTVAFPAMFLIIPSLIITTMTMLLTILFYIVGDREKKIVENQKLLTENIRSRYETLKSQINPHFLFNSLNTLNGLIGIDNDKAKEYVHQLSSVFRYSVQNKEVTTLDDELVFTEAFCHLVRIRYGESLVIESSIDEKYRSYSIMPLSLQTLVENAIKHNTISNRYPLKITIESADNATIRVSNKIQPKGEDTSGEGIGLANLAERYKMLYQKEVTISDTNGIFSVEIPLISNGK
jgi:sensor histidine kinase YesM